MGKVINHELLYLPTGEYVLKPEGLKYYKKEDLINFLDRVKDNQIDFRFSFRGWTEQNNISIPVLREHFEIIEVP
jgi:hypothetical protein